MTPYIPGRKAAPRSASGSSPADHEVHLYGMHYWDGPETIEKEGVILHGVCEPYELYTDGRRFIPQAIKFAANLAPHLLREDFDIIDCQQFPYFRSSSRSSTNSSGTPPSS
jgi:hypothetical protein